MERRHLMRHLRANGCRVLKEGGRHTRVVNETNGNRSVVPRHTEIPPSTVRDICRQLGIPLPAGN
jgi:predicted RNA binding protein YcfA (HicA-like mRNA interferase family)